MDKLPPYPFRPQLQLEKEITDQISSRLPPHLLDVSEDIQRQLESQRQHVIVSARSMGKSVSPSDVYLAQLRHGYYDIEGCHEGLVSVSDKKPEFKPEQFCVLNDENINNHIRMAMGLTANKPKGEW